MQRVNGGRNRKPRAKRSARNRLFQVVCLLIALGVGLVIFGKKVGAEPAVRGLSAPGDAPSTKKPGKKEKDAGVDAAATAAAAASAAAASAAAAAPKPPRMPAPTPPSIPTPAVIDYAVVQTDDDFPKDMTDEEKASIGIGKVPDPSRGRLSSPFAHPRFGGPAHVKVGLVLREIREYDIQTGRFEADFFLSLTGDKEMPT